MFVSAFLLWFVIVVCCALLGLLCLLFVFLFFGRVLFWSVYVFVILVVFCFGLLFVCLYVFCCVVVAFCVGLCVRAYLVVVSFCFVVIDLFLLNIYV